MSKRSVFVVLTLVGISLMFLASSATSGKESLDVIQLMGEKGLLAPADDSFHWKLMYEFDEGVWIGLRLRIDHKTWYWPSLWVNNPEGTSHQGDQWLEWYQRGNMKMRRYVQDNPGDYLSFGLVVESGSSVAFDADTQMVLFYKGRIVESVEVLVPDKPEETRVFRNTVESLTFSENQTNYMRNGPIFVFIVRFPDGSLGKRDPLDGGDFDRPIAFGIQKGGEISVPDQFAGVVKAEGVQVSLGGER